MKLALKIIGIVVASLVGLILIVGILVAIVGKRDLGQQAATGMPPGETVYEDPVKEFRPAYLVPTVSEVQSRFNAFAEKNNFDETISSIDVTDGEVNNTAMVRINANAAWTLSLNKVDNSVKEIVSIGASDGTARSGVNMLLSMSALIAVVEPNLPPAGRGDVLKKLQVLGSKNDLTNLDEKYDHNGVHYWVTSSKELGLWFGASLPKEDSSK